MWLQLTALLVIICELRMRNVKGVPPCCTRKGTGLHSGGGRERLFFPLASRKDATPLLAEATRCTNTFYSRTAHHFVPWADERKGLVIMRGKDW